MTVLHLTSDPTALAGSAPGVLPYRPPRRLPRKRGLDWGLPAEADRRTLATGYLTCQRQHWPLRTGILPKTLPDGREDPTIVQQMSDALASRHMNQTLDNDALTHLSACEAVRPAMGSGYLRYSCDNSNQRSREQ